MKCENCGKNEVSFVYRSSINGRTEEHHLCLSIYFLGCSAKSHNTGLMGTAGGRTSGNMDTWKDSVGELFLADPLNAGL